MTDFRYIGPPYNLGQCQEQSFGTTVSCDACIDPFNVDKPPTPIGQAPGKDMALIDIARMGRWVFLHITGVLLPKAFEADPSWGDQDEKGKVGPLVFADNLPRQFIGKSAIARTFIISMCDYNSKDDVSQKKKGETQNHSGRFTISPDGSMKITDLSGNGFVPLYGEVKKRPYLGFKTIDVFYCINNYEECETTPDPEVPADLIDQNGVMSKWERMTFSADVEALMKTQPPRVDDPENDEDI